MQLCLKGLVFGCIVQETYQIWYPGGVVIDLPTYNILNLVGFLHNTAK